jgi:hypothetical protein
MTHRHRAVSARIVFLSVGALMFACSVKEVPQQRRGPFAFHYRPSLTKEDLLWYSQFDLLVTHDPLPRDQVDRLHAAGTRLLLYEWAVAFYESRATDWQRSLLATRNEDLLNQAPLTGASGSPTSGAWYFDPATPQHELGRATEIARRIEETGYDGVFFDTTTVENVHPEARTEYERRHPHTPYDLGFSRFLIQLRQKLPKGIIFTNQGYRSAEYYLPYADWDLTESLVTWPHNGSYQMRPWNDPADPWNSIHFLMRKVIEPAAARYPGVHFGHLNYISAPSPETIRLVVAVAQLCGGEGYVAAPSTGDEIDPVYFHNPGKPLSALVDRPDGMGTYRFFERGLIAVTAAAEKITIDNLGRKGLRNRFTGQLICGDVITLPPAPGQPRAYFFDNTSDCGTRR